MSRKVTIVCILSGLVSCLLAEDRGKGKSYEELFMGLHRPFSESKSQPKPGSAPADTARALYGNEVFFNLRNSFRKPITDYLALCFSKALLQHFDSSRAKIDRWFEHNQKTNMKLPLNEGSIFVGGYEGASRFRIGESVVAKDTAKVTIHLTYTEGGKDYEWTDTAIFVQSNGVWLLDDIVFNPSVRVDYTLRKRTTIDEKP